MSRAAPMGLANFVLPAGARVLRRRRPAGPRWRELLATAARWTAGSPCVRGPYYSGRYEPVRRAKREEGLRSSEGSDRRLGSVDMGRRRLVA